MKEISWSQAFAHCASTGSYWAWIGIIFVAVAITTYFLIQSLKTSDWKTGHSVLLGVMIVALALAVEYRPGEVKANTTPEQAARGIYIGY